MSKAAAQPAQHNATTKSQKTALSSRPQLRVGRELLDTTWRMTAPVVLCAGLGIMLDRGLNTKPWLTLVGMIIGFGLAGLLVKLQLDRWPAEIKPGKYKNYYKDENEDKDYYND
jgi:F0F1-type ATP synthase assembly protein I